MFYISQPFKRGNYLQGFDKSGYKRQKKTAKNGSLTKFTNLLKNINFRQFCGLGTTKTWDDLKDLISDELVHRLIHTYRTPDDVDMYIAQVMEKRAPGSQLGPTAHCLISNQFANLQKADRFFYTNQDQFTPSQLLDIKQQSLSSLLCANADNPETLKIQSNVFKKVDIRFNYLKSCSEFPEMNLFNWF